MDIEQVEYRLKERLNALINKALSAEGVWRDEVKDRFWQAYYQPVRQATESFLTQLTPLRRKAVETKKYAEQLVKNYT